jgi:hypothetical protein
MSGNAHPPKVAVVSEREGQRVGLPPGEYLLTLLDDGSTRLAWRENSWATWSPPAQAEPR